MQKSVYQPSQEGFVHSSRGETGASQETLSEMIIPAVPGEYYGYGSRFTDGKPLYALMKCRANKARMVGQAEQLGHEANMFFQFEGSYGPQVHSIKKAHASGLLGASVGGESFGETWVARANITAEDFYLIRERQDMKTLVEICTAACSGREESADLEQETVIAVMTDAGKYGLFLVGELTPTTISVDACHILLP